VNNSEFVKIFVDKGKYGRNYSQVTNNRITSKILLTQTIFRNQKNYQQANTIYYDYDYYLNNKEKEEK